MEACACVRVCACAYVRVCVCASACVHVCARTQQEDSKEFNRHTELWEALDAAGSQGWGFLHSLERRAGPCTTAGLREPGHLEGSCPPRLQTVVCYRIGLSHTRAPPHRNCVTWGQAIDLSGGFSLLENWECAILSLGIAVLRIVWSIQ